LFSQEVSIPIEWADFPSCQKRTSALDPEVQVAFFKPSGQPFGELDVPAGIGDEDCGHAMSDSVKWKAECENPAPASFYDFLERIQGLE
jgi:hypothetical protein